MPTPTPIKTLPGIVSFVVSVDRHEAQRGDENCFNTRQGFSAEQELGPLDSEAISHGDG